MRIVILILLVVIAEACTASAAEDDDSVSGFIFHNEATNESVRADPSNIAFVIVQRMRQSKPELLSAFGALLIEAQNTYSQPVVTDSAIAVTDSEQMIDWSNLELLYSFGAVAAEARDTILCELFLTEVTLQTGAKETFQ